MLALLVFGSSSRAAPGAATPAPIWADLWRRPASSRRCASEYKLARWFHEGDCRKVCLVPHVLDTVIKGPRRPETEVPLSHDYHFGLCVETCPTRSLNFEIKGAVQAPG